MPKLSNIWTPKRLTLAALTAVVLGAVGVQTWRVHRTQTVERVRIEGARHADRAALLELAQVQEGERLYGLDPVLMADRLRRHPWVAEADVDRLPTGTLLMKVAEREPVALALADGRPAYYLDRDGYRMPADSAAVYDVPLVHGIEEAYQPVLPVEEDALRTLLAALDEADDDALLLVSELDRRGDEWWAVTVPAGERGAIPVRLGHDDYDEKLRRLRAFWHQAVLTQPTKRFERIDLRFDSQIITEEEMSDQQ